MRKIYAGSKFFDAPSEKRWLCIDDVYECKLAEEVEVQERLHSLGPAKIGRVKRMFISAIQPEGYVCLKYKSEIPGLE